MKPQKVGNLKIVQLLLSCGTDATLVDPWRDSSLHMTIGSHNIGFAEFSVIYAVGQGSLDMSN